MKHSVYRILHKPSGKFVKQLEGCMWYTSVVLNRNININIDFEKALTSRGVGHLYKTRKGAEDFLRTLVKIIRPDFEIQELK
jgi:hypothetical protein